MAYITPKMEEDRKRPRPMWKPEDLPNVHTACESIPDMIKRHAREAKRNNKKDVPQNP